MSANKQFRINGMCFLLFGFFKTYKLRASLSNFDRGERKWVANFCIKFRITKVLRNICDDRDGYADEKIKKIACGVGPMRTWKLRLWRAINGRWISCSDAGTWLYSTTRVSPFELLVNTSIEICVPCIQ